MSIRLDVEIAGAVLYPSESDQSPEFIYLSVIGNANYYHGTMRYRPDRAVSEESNR